MPIHRSFDTDFFKKWTPDMAYVLGFFLADGNIVRTKRGTHFISFYTADRSLFEMIRDSMSSQHKLSERASRTGSVYRLQIGSKEMFTDLLDLGVTPRKIRRLRLPSVPRDLLGHFVRGYFDGDGNVWIGDIHKDRTRPSRTIQAFFTSGSRSFLLELWDALKGVGIRGGSLYTPKGKGFSRLGFSTRDALRLAEIMYNGQPRLFLARKRLRFETFNELRS